MKYFTLILTAFCIALGGCASQQDVIILDDRLIELEFQLSKIKSVAKSQKTEGNKLRGQSAGLRANLNEIRAEIQALSGKIEETEFLLKQNLAASAKASDELNQKSEKQLDGLKEITAFNKDRITQIEQYLNLELSKSAHTVKPDLAKKPTYQTGNKLTENELYQQAKQAFDKGSLDAARGKFEEFLDRYPKSQKADNAQFWIGEVFYREKWYEKAILEYQKVIENYPKGNKVEDSLLKQGFAFYNLKDKPNSRLIFKELIKKYPGSNQAKIARKKLKEF
ncbi:MAG: tol-pal system protein YbgF [Deltaproteobacteria bacterium]|nr:tol-pal system protein YbgF [Deltaproteobacteria bacterium]